MNQSTIHKEMKRLGIPARTRDAEALHTKTYHEKRRKVSLGNRSHFWKGGSYLSPAGYVYTYAPQHPLAQKDGHVREHRRVMAAALGRPLSANEFVHHKNGNRSDNRIENLSVMSPSEHSRLPHTMAA